MTTSVYLLVTQRKQKLSKLILMLLIVVHIELVAKVASIFINKIKVN